MSDEHPKLKWWRLLSRKARTVIVIVGGGAGAFLVAAGFNIITPEHRISELKAQDAKLTTQIQDANTLRKQGDSLITARVDSLIEAHKQEAQLIRGMAVITCLNTASRDLELSGIPCTALGAHPRR